MKSKWIVSLGFLLALVSCRLEIDTGTDITGSGYYTSEYRSLAYFNQVKLNGIGDAQIVKGSDTDITVEADQNILPYIKTEVSNQVLVISIQGGVSIHPSRTIRYRVSSTSIASVTLNGTGNATVSGIDANNVNLTLNGAGNIDATGSCNYLTALIAGTGDIDASDLKARTAYATLKGTGNITVWTTDYLNAKISGCGNIGYYGNPFLDSSVTGIGSVNWLGY